MTYEEILWELSDLIGTRLDLERAINKLDYCEVIIGNPEAQVTKVLAPNWKHTKEIEQTALKLKQLLQDEHRQTLVGINSRIKELGKLINEGT